MEDEIYTYYTIYFLKGDQLYYTDSYEDKSDALEVYADYIAMYSKVAIIKTVEKNSLIMGSLDLKKIKCSPRKIIKRK